MSELRSQRLMQLGVEFDDPQTLDDTPTGTRRILHVKHGSFSGPKLEGRVLPGGGDWVLLRRDGVAQLDIRFTLLTSDGTLIYMSSVGIFDVSSDVRQRILKGEDVSPTDYYFRTALFFETGAKNYDWLNRLIAVGVGKRTQNGMVTDVFAVK